MSVPKTAFLAASSIAGYAIYSDDRKSRINRIHNSITQFSSSLPLQLSVFFGSNCFERACANPHLYTRLKAYFCYIGMTARWDRFEQYIYSARASRNLWLRFPATYPGMNRAIFGSSPSSVLSVQSTDPVCPQHLLDSISDRKLRAYLIAISALVDKYPAALVCSAEEADELLSLLKNPHFRRNAIQDIRNGRLFDRYSNSQIDHLLRNDFEKWIFKNRPDPQRSLEIADSEDVGILLPRLSVIIDESGGNKIPSVFEIPVICPFLKNSENQIIAVTEENGYLSLPSWKFLLF